MKQLGVVVFAVVLGACSKQAPKPMDPNQDPASRAAVEKLEGFSAQMCACQDAICALNTLDARAQWLAASYGEVTLSIEQRAARDTAGQSFDACADKARARLGPSTADEAIIAMTQLRDQMCACKDTACVDRVAETFAAMGEKYRDTKATSEQIKAAGEVAEAYGKCMAAVYNAAP